VLTCYEQPDVEKVVARDGGYPSFRRIQAVRRRLLGRLRRRLSPRSNFLLDDTQYSLLSWRQLVQLGNFRVGCSGWNYAPWRELVYPKGLPQSRWLDHYATLFDTVEVNTTFYRLPSERAVANWVAESSPSFIFAVKASRYLTHIKRLIAMNEGITRFYERIGPLVRSTKLGPVLWQLPPNFECNHERLATAIAALPPGLHAFEFRHPSWFVDETYDVLRRHGIAVVVAHDARRGLRPVFEATADFAYIRFHYGSRGRRGNYSERELEVWAQRIDAWRESQDVYAYFNNDWEGFAVANGLWLRKRLAG
jgi:uncharacterized protein YecE (DUF72 family)